jgi:hypothetical protein
MVGNAPINMNPENEVAAGTLRQVHETTRVGGNRSDNEIHADEITMPLRAPCVDGVPMYFISPRREFDGKGSRTNRTQVDS